MATELDHAPAQASAVPSSPDRPARDHDDRGRRLLAILLPVVLLLVAAGLRFYRLGEPPRQFFDETYYAVDAEQYLRLGVEDDFSVHPPVGKWLLASGIALFGYDSFGWRAAAAAAGSATVLVLYVAALRLFRRRGIAALSALLLTVDGLAFTMSRIAMLDVFLMLFVTLGFAFLLIDRDRQWAGLELLVPEEPEAGDQPPELPTRPHPWRWLAGVAFGLALATKWSAVLAIAAAGLFVLASDLLWRRRITGRPFTRPLPVVSSLAGSLLLIPLAVYVLSYAGWFTNFEHTRRGIESCPEGVCAISTVGIVDTWLDEQRQIANFHRTLEAEHPYRAPATTWFFMSRPVAYYWEACDDPANPPEGGCQVAQGNVEHIVGLANPAIWWLALLSYPVLGAWAIGGRDWRAAAILAFLILQTVPWHLTPRPVFFFYLTPAIPFVCLALAYASWQALQTRGWRWIPAAVAGLAVSTFLFFWPVLIGAEIPRTLWNLRMWLRSWI